VTTSSPTAGAGAGRWPWARWLPAMFALAIAASYSNAFRIDFELDDWHTIQRNPFVRSLANIPRFFTDPATSSVLPQNQDLRPLHLVSLAVNYAISGYDTWSYHALNLILHWLAVVLVFRIVRDHLWLGESAVPVAAGAALIMALHPLNTTPVDYLSARSAVLTTLFYLAAFDAAARERRLACLGFFALALLTKAIAGTFPLVVLGYLLLARAQQSPADRRPLPWGFLAALLALDAAGGLYRLKLVPAAAFAGTHGAEVTRLTYFMTEWSAYLYYVRLFVWPDQLAIDRLDYPRVSSLLETQAWASLLALLVLIVAAWRVRRRAPALAFAALWFFVTLAAESTFFPLAEPINEHRPYLAMLGLTTAASFGLWTAVQYAARALTAPPPWLFAGLIALLSGVLGTATYLRNQVWHDSFTLWMDATRKAPGNARAWLNAGHAAMERGNYDETRRLLNTALPLAPCYVYTLFNLTALDLRTGHPTDALAWADKSVACQPGQYLTHYHRGVALEALGRIDEAIVAYRTTVTVNPQDGDGWYDLGRLLEQQKKWADAASAYDHSLGANPTQLEAAMHAGLLYHHYLGNPGAAVERYRQVLRLNPNHYGAHYQLATALLANGQKAEARAAWRAFVPLAEALGDKAALARAPAELKTPD
jgi:tetratricopeptide (TPR) repeat protein